MIILGSSVSFFNTFCLLLRFFLLSINFHEPTDDTWNDFTNKHGNKLHVGKLEFKTKHGKKPKSFIKHVRPRDVKSALCLVIQLFLEQPKVSAEDSEIHDSLMQDIKKSAFVIEIPQHPIIIGDSHTMEMNSLVIVLIAYIETFSDHIITDS